MEGWGILIGNSKLEVVVRAVIPGEGSVKEEARGELLAEIRADEESRLRDKFVEELRRKVARGEVISGLRVVVEKSDSERLLPPDVVEFYSRLCHRALDLGRGVFVGDPIEKAKGRPVTRVSSGQTETRGGAKGSRKSGGSKDFILDAGAFAYKGKVDRKLRALAREMKAWLQDSGEPRDDVRRCSGCKKFGEPHWLYCPHCSKPMESV